MTDSVKTTISKWGLELGPAAERRLRIFAAELTEKNSMMNLVSKNDEPLLWERHILDSLAGAGVLRRLVKPGAAIADAGSGAGFPGLVLAAALDEFKFELLDSRGKRCDFLGLAAASMLCANVAVFQRRVGEGGPGAETRYAAVIERAMGQLENILPQCLNILDKGGYFLAWQSAAQLSKRRPEVQKALARAGGRLIETVPYRLPGETEDRHIVVFGKDR